MEFPAEKQALASRAAICAAAAWVLYRSGGPICAALKLTLWEEHRPWLEKNKVQAVAIVAAVLFGLSLALFPVGEEVPPPPEGFCPCEEG